ncbi:phage tail tape measure protein [Bacteroides cellulosilyticus]|uniref:phage tail tape measure protein n=1 Tax=Bacteroides cellulosilyticus TaxID=246787 RepID=UPI0021B2E70A|nr:phage tail tape measure protein [Bacteroides cellulosilyticus]UWZ88977.1 phage tail tape measure protein [Bacteroides cellulosilyticus]
MGEFGISGLIKAGELEALDQCDVKLIKIKNTYVDVAKELAKGIKMEIETPKELDKLFALYSAQVATAEKTNTEFNVTLDKQKKVLQEVADNLQKQASASDLSAKDMKQLADANAKNAAALEKVAKAELAATKAQNSGNSTRRNANISEEERLRIIKDAITLTNREVHSIIEAETANKQLRQAVKLLRDTDADYITILARLNSTIDTNSNYSKKNSDAQTRQKLTVGAYREEVKLAILEINKGNNTLRNFGTIAGNTGKILNTQLAPGFAQIGVGMKTLISGYVGAQAVISGIVKLFTLLREGAGDIVKFEFANSNLAAILGTTSDKIKDLTADAQRLGATTKYTASQATELQIELAKLGFTKKEILDSTSAILRFAQATGAELSEAAALSGAALRMFNADTKDTEQYVSAMAIATSKSALSFSYLATALPIVGPVAKAFNCTIEDTLALLGKLADAGFDASSSATATRNILLNLADGSGKLAKALGKPVKTLPELVNGLQSLKDKGVDLNTTLELTDKRSVAAFNAFLTAADKIVPLRNQITGVESELADMANTMGDNVQGAIANLSSAWEAFMLSFSNTTGPAKEFLNWMADKIRSIANDLKTPEEKIGQIETDFREMAKKRANAKILDEEKEFNAEYKRLRDAGDTDEEARTKALIQLSNKRIEITASERAEVEKLKKGAQYSTFEFENMSKFKNAAALMFGVYTKEAEKADKAQLNFSKSFFSLVESEEYNAGIDKIIDKYSKVTVDDDANNTKTLTDKEKRELEKAAAEKLKIQETYQASVLALMNEGLDKELKKIGLDYSKKIAAVKGYSKEEIATRENLAKEMQNAIQRFSIQYNANREKQDIANSLEVVQKGSKEELALKFRQLDLQCEAEIDAAEKTGEDVFAIDQKYSNKKQLILEENAAYQIQFIAENAAAEQIIRDQTYQADMLSLKKQLAEKKITQREYAEQEYQLTLDYVRKSNEAAIDALELELKTDNLSSDDRAKIAEELQKLKAELAQKEAEAEIAAIEKVTKADEKSHKDRMRSLQDWLQTAQQAIGSIGDLIATVYDGQITKIEDEQDANNDAYDQDIERIEKKVEYGLLTEEEAEVKKRAAKEKTEAKNRELEKKKQELARKQAIWDKATSIAQAGIATALAITKSLPNFVLAAIVGAMGAIQVATIAATPIPSYAEGTKDGAHPGGKALVGDAGKREVVMYKGMAWITPDTPMLVDLPKGAQVFPDVDDFGSLDWQNNSFAPMFSFLRNSEKGGAGTTVYNDYSGLERRMDMTNNLLVQSIKQRRREAYKREFDLYILRNS